MLKYSSDNLRCDGCWVAFFQKYKIGQLGISFEWYLIIFGCVQNFLGWRSSFEERSPILPLVYRSWNDDAQFHQLTIGR
ncbi:hypothetical protein QUA70_19325 [Microcoleus sp. LAD1_D5]|uniref:hypothetical protein n=1 Tax=unclassified Microcoleus TaxID=2642155 RepID=UPI002FD329D6